MGPKGPFFLFAEVKGLLNKIFKAKKELIRSDEIMMGEKVVKIPKLTVAKMKEIIRTVENLPGMAIQVLLAPREELHAYVVAAFDLASDEIVKVVAILADLDEKYVAEKVGINEIIEFVKRTIEYNDLSQTVKNVKSLLMPKAATKEAEPSTTGSPKSPSNSE